MKTRLAKKSLLFGYLRPTKDFERIFSSYNFGAVVYIAQSIYRKEPYYGEYQDLEAVLRISCEHEIPRFVCISPKYQSTGNGIAEHDLAVMFSACDMLCDFYRKSRGISILKLSAPVYIRLWRNSVGCRKRCQAGKDYRSGQFIRRPRAGLRFYIAEGFRRASFAYHGQLA